MILRRLPKYERIHLTILLIDLLFNLEMDNFLKASILGIGPLSFLNGSLYRLKSCLMKILFGESTAISIRSLSFL
jgi:hypothetical protein